jgi:hypothetical protein
MKVKPVKATIIKDKKIKEQILKECLTVPTPEVIERNRKLMELVESLIVK